MPKLIRKESTVDPSVGSAGVAHWLSNQKRPVRTKLLTLTRTREFEVRCRQMAWLLAQEIRSFGSKLVWVEQPFVVPGTEATPESVLKLGILVGSVMASLPEDVECRLLPVRTWKGQLPKRVVIDRIRRCLGNNACDGFEKDVWDAVGMGLWRKGLINQERR